MIILESWGLKNHSDSETVLVDQSKQNPNSNGAAAIDYKGSRNVQVPPRCNPSRLDTKHDPMANNGSATPRQILDVQCLNDSC
jgi:hypothetical protein